MQFYLWQNEQQTGPYTLEEVQNRLRDGVIAASDLVWEEGMADWSPLCDIQDFRQAVSIAGVPPVASQAESSGAAGAANMRAELPAGHSSTRIWRRVVLVGSAIGLGLLLLLSPTIIPIFRGASRSHPSVGHPLDRAVEMRGGITGNSSEDGRPIPVANIPVKFFKAQSLAAFLDGKVQEFAHGETTGARALQVSFEGIFPDSSVEEKMVDATAASTRKAPADPDGQRNPIPSSSGAFTDALGESGQLDCQGAEIALLSKLWFDFLLADLPTAELTATTDSAGQVRFKAPASQQMIAVVECAVIPETARSRTLKWFLEFSVDGRLPLAFSQDNELSQARNDTLFFQSLQRAILSMGEGAHLVAKEADVNEKNGARLFAAARNARRLKEYDLATSKLTTALQEQPAGILAASLVLGRGEIYKEKGDLEKALSDFNEALRLFPAYGRAHLHRAVLYARQGKLDKALQDSNAGIRLNPKSAPAYRNRGAIHEKKAEYKLALEDYLAAFKIAPDQALNSMAWLFSTCPEAEIRNGKSAVVLAKKACDLAQWKDWESLDTLAAACSETGLFAEAIQCENLALGLVGGEDAERTEMKLRLELYQRNMPFRSKPGQYQIR